jgi:hypothetical protein
MSYWFTNTPTLITLVLYQGLAVDLRLPPGSSVASVGTANEPSEG